MVFTMKTALLLLTAVAVATCQFNYQNFNKFRPSPIDNVGSTIGVTNNYNPAHNPYRPPVFTPDNYQGYLPHARPQFGFTSFDSPPRRPLFTPAEYPYPAASSGQIDNYNKALQEEAAEAQKAQQNQFYNTNDFNTFGGSFGKSYVDVKFGPNNYQYQYTV